MRDFKQFPENRKGVKVYWLNKVEKTAAKAHMKGATAQETVDLPTRILEKLPGKTSDKYNTVWNILAMS